MRIQEITYKLVRDSDLEALIAEVYELEGGFSVAADLECGNDSYHRFEVRAKAMGEYSQSQLNKFTASKKQGESRMLSYILLDLCNRSYIAPGQYLIEVSW